MLEEWQNPLLNTFTTTDPRWQKLTQEERVGFMHIAEAEAAEVYGYSVRGVFPSNSDDFHFSYTVNHDPPLVVTGFSSSGAVVLASAVEFWPQQEPEVVFIVDDHPCVFIPVPAKWAEENVHTTEQAYQFLAADDANLWPWQERHPHQGRGGMPVLLGDDWRPKA